MQISSSALSKVAKSTNEHPRSRMRSLDLQGEVRDSWSTTFAEPALDESSGGSSDVTLYEFSEQDGFTEIHFSRPLDTGDATDRIINKDQPTNIIYAWGSADALAYHGVSNRGKDTITV